MSKTILAFILATLPTLALGCAGFDGGGGAGDTSSAPTSRLDQLGQAATTAGAGMQAAGAAVAPANPMIGAGLTAAGTIIAGVGGLIARRKVLWGTIVNRRTKRGRRGDVWTDAQRAAVRLTLAANSTEPTAAADVVAATTPASSSRIGPRPPMRAAA